MKRNRIRLSGGARKRRRMGKKAVLAWTCFFLLALNLCPVKAEIDPDNIFIRGGDNYKMPVWDEVLSKSLLQYELNMDIPQLLSNIPAQIKDRKGNVDVYHKGEKRNSVSNDGTVTYYANGSKAFAKRQIRDTTNISDEFGEEIANKGDLYLFRVYRREDKNSGKYTVYNEFNDIVGYQIYGEDDKLFEQQDYEGRTTHAYQYDRSGYWVHDLVNNTFSRIDLEMSVEERLGSKDGNLLSYWETGEHFGIHGLWLITKDWDGDKIVDSEYTLYNEFGDQAQAVYNREGGQLKVYAWEKNRLRRIDDLQNYQYYERNDFGISKVGELDDEANSYELWDYYYQGSQQIDAVRDYEDAGVYDRQVFDLAGNVIRTERRDIYNNEVIEVLSENIYFSEVKDMTAEEIKELFEEKGYELSVEQSEAFVESIIGGLIARGRADAAFLGSWDHASASFTVLDEYNNPSFTMSLEPLNM